MEGKVDSRDDVNITGSEEDKNKSFYSGGPSTLIRVIALEVKLIK
jgi:hypothetical protein